jgi:rubrerythrin
MNVFDYAMQMEKDGEQYYRELAGKCGDAGLSKILLRMADAEVKHFAALAKMKANQRADLASGEVRAEAKNLFRQLQESGAVVPDGMSQVALYRKAQDVEAQSRHFYLERAGELERPEARESFYRIADEEKLHYDMIGSIIEFVSRAEPGNWLEDAEWFHHEDY